MAINISPDILHKKPSVFIIILIIAAGYILFICKEDIFRRRSQRTFEQKDLSLQQISQLLWAAQGIIAEKGFHGFRTAPSAPIGAFNDEEVKKILSLPIDHEPLYIIPVGY